MRMVGARMDKLWREAPQSLNLTHEVSFLSLSYCSLGTKKKQSRDTTVFQQFFWYRYFAGIRFNWAVGISVRITSLAGTPFFRKRGAECIEKGACAPFFPQKGGQGPLFEGKRGSRQKNDTKMYRPRFPLVSLSLYGPGPGHSQNFGNGLWVESVLIISRSVSHCSGSCRGTYVEYTVGISVRQQGRNSENLIIQGM